MVRFLVTMLIAVAAVGCGSNSVNDPAPGSGATGATRSRAPEIKNPAIQKVLAGAHDQLTRTRGYSQGYVTIAYPGGDVPIETGACTDVIIRAFRNAGVDLQKEVHEDMVTSFSAYPSKWGMGAPDSNIDHRRVPNLQTFFTRKGKALPVTSSANDYKPGDVVSWDLDGKGMTHIGLVSDVWSDRMERYLVIHNIGGGTNLEDRLFAWNITGHYRYF